MTHPTILPERLARLDGINLDGGGHSSDDYGKHMCFNEAVAWLAGEPHSDAPACVSPVLRSYTIRLNDRWDHEQRQQLKPYLVRVIGTAGDGKDEARLRIARTALLVDLLPAWLVLAGMDDDAALVRSWAAEDGLEMFQLRGRLWDLRDRARAKRSASREALKARVKQLVTEKLAAADADAVADAVAVAVADADAVADAAAVAVADAAAAAAAVADADAAAAAVAAAVADADAVAAADAVAVAAADAVADAVAVAVAVAVADAVAVAVGAPSWKVWDVAYEAAKKVYDERFATSDDPQIVKIRELGDRQCGMALQILDRMIDPEAVA